MADQSRWFIKEKPLEDRIKACKKSLEAAVRSQRANIAEALRAKLAKLQAEQTFASPKSRPTAEAAGAKRKVKKVKKVKGKVVASASPESCSVLNLTTRPASADSDSATIDRPATTLPKKKSSGSSKNSKLAESSKLSKRTKLKDSSKVSKSIKKSETPKNPKKSKSKKPSSVATSDSGDRATAIELLLRAATAAKAARRAAGEESEEEAPLPELPMPRKDFSASNGMAMTAADVEEMESEEPPEDDDDGEPPKASKHQEEDEDEDFFDSVEDPLPMQAEAESGKRTASLRGAAKRAKKQRRKERLELIREEPLLKHPSWVAQKRPRVSGAFSAVKGKKGKRTTFASDSE